MIALNEITKCFEILSKAFNLIRKESPMKGPIEMYVETDNKKFTGVVRVDGVTNRFPGHRVKDVAIRCAVDFAVKEIVGPMADYKKITIAVGTERVPGSLDGK